MQKILVFIDGSETSLRAVDKAAELAKQGASITALHVFPPRLDRDLVSQFEIEPEDLDAQFARRCIEDAERRFREEGVEASFISKEGPVAEGICAEGERGDYDLILIGGRAGVSAKVYDLAEVVRRKAKLPVEIIY